MSAPSDAVDDVWADYGREEARGDGGSPEAAHLNGEAAAKPSSTPLDIWDAGEDDYVVPPRGWLLGHVFCRRFLSSLVAEGGTGKTALRIAQLVSLAIGRSLTGEHLFQRCRVLILSLEDDRDELRRRVLAVIRHHRVDPAELRGWLFLSAPKGLRLAEIRDGAPREASLRAMLEATIAAHRIDIVSLDPFVKTHALEENDNGAIDFVCGLLAKMAIEHDIAVDATHHAKKGGGSPGDAERSRGASSMKDAARLVFTLSAMTPEEAQQLGVAEAERRRLIRLDSAKVNIAPPSTEATWFRLVGVPLDNGTALYPHGDEVQAVEPWMPPDLWRGLSTVAINAALSEIETGIPTGQRYSSASAAGKRAAWAVVQKHVPERTEAQCRQIIAAWLKSGLLYAEDYLDPVDRKQRSGLRVNETKRPS